MSTSTVQTPVALAPKAANRIRMASFGALTIHTGGNLRICIHFYPKSR